jgi:hydrogenase maturation protease
MCGLSDGGRRTVLVLGLGNPLQADDGVGCRVIEALEGRELPTGVEVLDAGTPGVGLINLLEGRQRAIIVDAAEMGRQPGEVVRFRPEDVTLTGSTDRFSLHRTAVADALALAHALNLALPEIVVFGVQPGYVGWRDELSPEVAAAIPGLVDAILEQLRCEGCEDQAIRTSAGGTYGER